LYAPARNNHGQASGALSQVRWNDKIDLAGSDQKAVLAAVVDRRAGIGEEMVGMLDAFPK
jgi:hypothetical protein